MKNKKTLIIVLTIVLAVLLGTAGIYAFIRYRSKQVETKKIQNTQVAEKKTIKIGGNELLVEIADSRYKRTRGLAFRDNLGENEGMLFSFAETGIVSFWLKNMKFPIDIIWVGETNNIIKIDKNAQPCTQDPCDSFTTDEPTKYVIETNAGWTEKNNVNTGDLVEIN